MIYLAFFYIFSNKLKIVPLQRRLKILFRCLHNGMLIKPSLNVDSISTSFSLFWGSVGALLFACHILIIVLQTDLHETPQVHRSWGLGEIRLYFILERLLDFSDQHTLKFGYRWLPMHLFGYPLTTKAYNFLIKKQWYHICTESVHANFFEILFHKKGNVLKAGIDLSYNLKEKCQILHKKLT